MFRCKRVLFIGFCTHIVWPDQEQEPNADGTALENNNNVSWNTDSIEQAGKELDQGAVISLYPCKREEASILHVVGEPNKTQSIDQASHPELLGRRALVVTSINTVPTREHCVADLAVIIADHSDKPRFLNDTV